MSSPSGTADLEPRIFRVIDGVGVKCACFFCLALFPWTLPGSINFVISVLVLVCGERVGRAIELAVVYEVHLFRALLTYTLAKARLGLF